MASKFIKAYRTDTGEQVRIPEEWIGHPVLGEPFTTTAPSRTAPTLEKAPTGPKEK